MVTGTPGRATVWRVKERQRGATKLDIDVEGEPSIEPIGELVKLETLVLRGFKMNLAPLAKLTALRHLTLYLDRGVKGLEALGALTKLRSLTIEESSLATLEILKHLKELRELKVLGGLTSAKGIEGARQLEKAALERTQITSLAPLKPLTKLRELSLRFSRKLTDLTGIEALKSLREVDLYEIRGPLKSLAPIAKLPKLESLNTSLTPIKGGFAPLYKMKSLRALEGDASSPAELIALKKHLPKAKLFIDVDEDADDDAIEVGVVRVHKPSAGEPWTIFQDLVDDLNVSDQNDAEERIADAFKKAQPKLFKKVTFDSEGDAFVATSPDRVAIMSLAKLIERLVDAADED